jgi:23S rRNA (uracil1939-C5)-methyltransferase
VTTSSPKSEFDQESSLPSDPTHSINDKPDLWRQGELVEVTIIDLNHNGEGVGRYEGRVVFVPDTVPGDRLLARLIRVKPKYAYGKLHNLLDASPQRVRPGCIVADKCGGCQWQQVDYAYQLEAKRNLVIQDLERIGEFDQPIVDPVLMAEAALSYRNKATYPVAKAASGRVQAGYYQKGSHLLINLNQCPVQDPRLNPLLAEVKWDIERRGWRIYDEKHHRGQIRHLGLRIGRRTGEALLTLVSRDDDLDGLEDQAEDWLNRYPGLVGVFLNVNSDRTNAIFGAETRCIAGQPYLREEFAGLEFQIQPHTFFQVYTEQAEALLQAIEDELDLQGNEILLDAYCGIGTLTLPLARRVQQAVGLEAQLEAVEQARINAELNEITNVTFESGFVEQLLPTLNLQPNIVLLDPPRKGCDEAVLESLLQLGSDRIVYVSCNSATLARDLKVLCGQGHYRLTRVQPADFFPQTPHVEAAAFLEKVKQAE